MSANPNNLETCGLAEARQLLRCSESTLLRKVRKGIVPATKPGKGWVFIVEDLKQYLRSNYKKPACSIDVQTLRTGGSVSSSIEPNTASQLAQQIAGKRKNLRPKLEIVSGGKSGSAKIP